MAKGDAQHRRRVGQQRKLGSAAILLFVAGCLLYALVAGWIYRATGGADAGLYLTIASLLGGVVCAAVACFLAASALQAMRRRERNVVEMEARRREKRKAA